MSSCSFTERGYLREMLLISIDKKIVYDYIKLQGCNNENHLGIKNFSLFYIKEEQGTVIPELPFIYMNRRNIIKCRFSPIFFLSSCSWDSSYRICTFHIRPVCLTVVALGTTCFRILIKESAHPKRDVIFSWLRNQVVASERNCWHKAAQIPNYRNLKAGMLILNQ